MKSHSVMMLKAVSKFRGLHKRIIKDDFYVTKRNICNIIYFAHVSLLWKGFETISFTVKPFSRQSNVNKCIKIIRGVPLISVVNVPWSTTINQWVNEVVLNWKKYFLSHYYYTQHTAFVAVKIVLITFLSRAPFIKQKKN